MSFSPYIAFFIDTTLEVPTKTLEEVLGIILVDFTLDDRLFCEA